MRVREILVRAESLCCVSPSIRRCFLSFFIAPPTPKKSSRGTLKHCEYRKIHKLYSVSWRLNRRKAPAPRMAAWKSFRNRASFSVTEKRSMMAHSWTSNLSGSVRYRVPSCSWTLRASLTASRARGRGRYVILDEIGGRICLSWLLK